MAFVAVRGIVKSYTVGGRALIVLRDLDLHVDRGEMVAIVGASGVGKSTLLHLVGGLDRVDAGDIAIGDAQVTAMADGDLVAFRNREQQRVAVARALVMHPAVLLADEPTGDLDEATAEALHGLLREMHRNFGLTSIIATHNPRLAAACDRVLRLQEGRLVPA